MLDMGDYLKQWFAKVPIGVQVADFLQLRPTAQASLCEWVDAPRATDPAPPQDQQDQSDAEEAVEKEAAERTSNASELGRIAFKESLQRVVHFTGSGRFSKCASGQQLVRILLSMRRGEHLEDELWEALESRVISQEQLFSDNSLRARLLSAH